MDCKRVTVIRIGPVISTRMKALHGNVWCFFVLSAVHLTSPFYVPFHEKSVCRSPQAVTNAFYFTVRLSAF